ncbi:MAG: DUF11 domain-containing protein [Proteobacteria bacterium]|nr:DUF11 domain-containing protein [Pseudomonadota bacterium]
MPGLAGAQVQRSMINPSFESPDLTTPGCRVYINQAQVPGWTTNHPNTATENSGGCVVSGGLGTSPGPILELWKTPRDNASGGVVNAPDGTQIAELNAAVASRLYQNVCLINGESFKWTFSHRGRGSATAYDLANFVVGTSTLIAQVGTTNTGAHQTPVAYPGETAVAATNVAGNSTWVNYSGTYTFSGTTGTNSLGFEAVGGTTSGNLLDNIQIQLAPFVEFVQSSSSAVEAAGNNLPQIRINGTVFSPMTVTVAITGGNATRGATGATNVDYTTAGGSATLTMTIPAGVYDGTAATNSLFTLPVTIVDNTVVQSNRTIEFQLQASTANPKAYLLNSSSSCGASAQATSIYTIIDDDAGVAVTKNVTSKTAVAGNPSQFDIVYTVTVNNTSSTNTASYSLTDTPQFDSDVGIVSASYTKNGGSSTSLSGTAPWTLQSSWGSLAGSGTDTYVVTIRGQVARNGSTGNDACTSPGTAGKGLQNSVSATYKVKSGTNPTVNADTCSNTPTPGWVTLSKTLNGRAIAGDQAQVRIYAGGILANSASTSGTATPATATTGVQVFASGSVIDLRETILQGGTTATAPSTNYATAITCSNAAAGSTTVLPSGSGSASGIEQAWSGIALAAGDDISCTITNAPNATDLSITKTDGVTTTTAGAQTTYTIVAANGGPAAAVNALVKDSPDPAHLTACQVSTQCSVTAGTATCPTAANLTMANLSTGGVQIPLMAAGSKIQFQVTCTVQ